MSSEFGKTVWEKSRALQQSGRDANQIAKVLFQDDDLGHNYGIGIVLSGDGKPVASSATVLKYIKAELETSGAGTYQNSNAIMQKVKEAVLRWQQIPETHWPHFKIALPSDAGTGAVKTAVEMALQLDPGSHTLGIEELGWPAYKAIAKAARINTKEFPAEGIISGDGVLPIYQSGPMNTTGQVQQPDVIQERAVHAARHQSHVVLDRAYSGFEFARLLSSNAYHDIMKKSYERQIKPFIDQGASFSLCLSPTKAFITFAFRPCGLLLVFCPDSGTAEKTTTTMNATIRARGSAFEHPATRGLAKAFVNDLAGLEAEHKAALERLAAAENIWSALVKDTPIEYLYSDQYAGLFRNPKCKEDAAVKIYNAHIYPVFSQGRCRQNITGIPDNRELAKRHVAVFAEQCF